MTTTLSPAQRRALSILTDRSASIVWGAGRTLERLEVSYATAERLVLNGWARPVPSDEPDRYPQGALVITPAGRSILAQPVPETPVYLHGRDGLTTDQQHAADGEPEVIDAHTLSTWWTEQSLQRKAEATTRREQARRHKRGTLRRAR